MVQVRNVPSEFHRRLKARAAMEGMSMSDYILREVGKALDRPTRQDVLERLRADLGARQIPEQSGGMTGAGRPEAAGRFGTAGRRNHQQRRQRDTQRGLVPTKKVWHKSHSGGRCRPRPAVLCTKLSTASNGSARSSSFLTIGSHFLNRRIAPCAASTSPGCVKTIKLVCGRMTSTSRS